MDRRELEGVFVDAFGDSDVNWDDEPGAQNCEGESELDSGGPETDGAAENIPQNDARPPNKCQSFSRNKKLAVLTWHRKNNASKAETARHFSLPHHNYVSRWLAQEDQLRQHSRNTRCIGSGRRADSRCTGCNNSQFPTLILDTLVWPSRPGNTFSITPRFHLSSCSAGAVCTTFDLTSATDSSLRINVVNVGQFSGGIHPLRSSEPG